MLGNNRTPFAAIAFEQAHRNGSDMAVIAVRASYQLDGQGILVLADKQEIALIDEYAGDPQTSPLLKASDLVPFKPSTDVTALAKSRRPGDCRPEESWVAGIRIGSYRYGLRVCGPRQWLRQKARLLPGKSLPVDNVDIDYRSSWSDLEPGELPGDPPPLNSIGVRRPDAREVDRGSDIVMASIDAPNEDYADPFAVREPQGFGPLPPFWRQRQRFAGTFGERWLKQRHPLLPEDFDYRFHQCAHPRLVMNGHMSGGEEIELYRLHPVSEQLVFNLPAVQPWANFLWLDEREVSMRLNLDGVHIDARGAEVSVDLTWRGWLPICPQFFRIDVFHDVLGADGLEELPFSGIDGIEGFDASGEVAA
jgi:hypothetical protein